MAYKVILDKDLDQFYPEVTLTLMRTSIFGSTVLFSKQFEDSSSVPESYSEQTFRKRYDALKVYYQYVDLLGEQKHLPHKGISGI